MHFWYSMLQRLLVIAKYEINSYSKLHSIGSRAPQYMQGHGKDSSIFLLHAYLVKLTWLLSFDVNLVGLCTSV